MVRCGGATQVCPKGRDADGRGSEHDGHRERHGGPAVGQVAGVHPKRRRSVDDADGRSVHLGGDRDVEEAQDGRRHVLVRNQPHASRRVGRQRAHRPPALEHRPRVAQRHHYRRHLVLDPIHGHRGRRLERDDQTLRAAIQADPFLERLPICPSRRNDGQRAETVRARRCSAARAMCRNQQGPLEVAGGARRQPMGLQNRSQEPRCRTAGVGGREMGEVGYPRSPGAPDMHVRWTTATRSSSERHVGARAAVVRNRSRAEQCGSSRRSQLPERPHSHELIERDPIDQEDDGVPIAARSSESTGACR